MCEITLRCWSCGKAKSFEADRYLNMGVDFIKFVQDNGMIAKVDRNRQRVLAFCSDECVSAQRTKGGYFRKYPKRGAKCAEGAGQDRA